MSMWLGDAEPTLRNAAVWFMCETLTAVPVQSKARADWRVRDVD